MFHFFKSRDKSVRVPLGVLSALWTTDDMKDRHAGDARPCEQDRHARRRDITFASEDILGFYNKYIAPYVRGQGLDVIIRLLDLLDRQGDCPSVVQGDDETPERYRTLGHITLAEHSLSVARNAFDMRNNGRRIIRSDTPDILIAALGHDTGKIPVPAQKEIPGHTFSTLALLKQLLADTGCAEKILEAVRLLHVREKDRKKRKKDLSILRILEQADIQARDAELKTAGPAAQPNAKPVRLTEDALLCAMKPQLLKDVSESFMFEDKVFLAPAFIKEAAIGLAKGDGGPDSLRS